MTDGMFRSDTDKLRHRVRFTGILLTLILVGAAVTWQTARITETKALDELRQAGAPRLNLYASSLKGALEKKSFTIEKTFESGVTDTFFRFTGCRTGQLDLNFAANEFVTGRLAYTGGNGAKAVTEIAGARAA